MEINGQPFTTTNAALAVTLHALGVPWHREPDAEHPFPCVNTYTADMLRAEEEKRKAAGLRPIGFAGKTLDDAVKLAHKAGIPGHVTYFFRRTPTLLAILEGWDAQADFIRKSDEADPDTIVKSDPLMVMPEIAGRLACQILRTRRDFFGDKNTQPMWKRGVQLADTSTAGTRSKGKDAEAGSVTRGSLAAHSVKVF